MDGMGVCTFNRLIARSFTGNVESTAKSFKSWDTCMNNKACKIIAIVGIALAAVVALWLIGAVLTCFRQGVSGIGEFFCWCCNCGRNSRMPANEGYGRTSQVPAPATVVYQPIQQPESAYYRKADDAFFDERRKSDVFELEQEFDLEKQREKSRKSRLPVVGHDVDDNSVYQPSNTVTPTNPWQAFNPQNRSSTHQSPYPYDNVLEYQGHNYYHGGYSR